MKIISFLFKYNRLPLYVLLFFIFFPILVKILSIPPLPTTQDLAGSNTNKQQSPPSLSPNQPIVTTKQAPNVKEKLLMQLPNNKKSGVIYQQQEFSIEYIREPDVFKVEILSKDINTAKKLAAQWFLSQGASNTDLCTLPVQFYLNFDVANHADKTQFNPLPDGC